MPTVSVELNFYYLHYNDAKTLAEWARERQTESVNPSIYARHAILSVVFAAEALINRVLVEFSSAPDVFDVLEKYSILDKWTLAPFLCVPSDRPEPFGMGEEPMQSFKELVQLRNWLAHPKVDNFLPANLDPTSTISGDLPDEEYPWLEMLKGDIWRQTKILKNPFEITYAHAAAAVTVLDQMVDALRRRLCGQMHESWLELIAVKDDQVFTITGHRSALSGEAMVVATANYAMQRSSRVVTPLAVTTSGTQRFRSASGAPTARRR